MDMMIVEKQELMKDTKRLSLRVGKLGPLSFEPARAKGSGQISSKSSKKDLFKTVKPSEAIRSAFKVSNRNSKLS